MKKSILIVGAGSGLSSAVAEKFGSEGFHVNLISRNIENLRILKELLNSKHIQVDYAAADAGDSQQLGEAINLLKKEAGNFDVVLYNAAVLKKKDIMEETSFSLAQEFTVNVGSALEVLQMVYADLKEKKGAFLITGGGLALTPSPTYGSLSIGKAALRNLAYQLHERLESEGIFVGLLTVDGFVDPNSLTHSPEVLANLFWTKLYLERSAVEILQ